MYLDDQASRDLLTEFYLEAVSAADPQKVLHRFLPDHPAGRTVVIGCGKGAAQMARSLELMWDAPLEGTVVTRYGYSVACERIEVLEAAHPVPDEAGLRATARLFERVSNLTADDLVIALICGGGSALLPAPRDGLTFADEVELNRILLASGAPISAMNTVRKQLSLVKGGRLAAAAYPARVVSLVVSDIPGDKAELVASGPTIPDASTREDALRVVRDYGLELPASVQALLESETTRAPLPGDPVFARCEHHIVASAGRSLEAVARAAAARGIEAHIISDSIEGEASHIARMHAAIVRQMLDHDRPFRRPALLLSGGETTVSIRNKGGRGGRNGEFALAFSLAMEGHRNFACLAADTDGIDGSEDNAGAFVFADTIAAMRRAGIRPEESLRDNDSYTAFRAVGALFEPGPSGTNVNDLRAILVF